MNTTDTKSALRVHVPAGFRKQNKQLFRINRQMPYNGLCQLWAMLNDTNRTRLINAGYGR